MDLNVDMATVHMDKVPEDMDTVVMAMDTAREDQLRYPQNSISKNWPKWNQKILSFIRNFILKGKY